MNRKPNIDTFTAKFNAMKKWMIIAVLCWQPMLLAQEWNKNFDEAVSKSQSNGKPVLLLFSVPDACDICREMEENVFNTAEFKAFADDNLVLAKPDFSASADRMTKAGNLLIVEKYDKDGFFPWVVLIRNGKVIGKLGNYDNETAQQYITKLQSIIHDK